MYKIYLTTLGLGLPESKTECLSDERTHKENLIVENISTLPFANKNANIVRIYISSAGKDTECEREALLEQAYPRIKKHCHDQGYEFQLVDFSMGLCPWATNDHMFEEICLQELLLCRTVSTGPNFVSLSCQKYGPQSLPRIIGEKEFNKIMSCVEKDENVALLKRWYQLDEKAMPPCYTLRPINLNIPSYLSIFGDQREKSEKEWKRESETMLDVLYKAAGIALNESDAKKLIRTGVESETAMGIFCAPEPRTTCHWFHRQFNNLDEVQDTTKEFLMYTEKGRPMFEEENQDLHIKMERALEQQRISKYSIKWTENGVDIENPDHLQYLKRMCGDFEQNMISMIDQAIKYKQELPETISSSEEEVLRHLQTCQDNCQNIVGQGELIQKIKEYIFSDNKDILAVGGGAGAGKTSVMAMAVKQASLWLGEEDIVISRFVGTTKQSSNLPSLLKSIINQVRRVSRSPPTKSEVLKGIRRDFKKVFSSNYMMKNDIENRKFVIFVDSIERLDPKDDSHILSTWLPKKVLSELKYTCKLIISYQDKDEPDIIFHVKEIIPKENLLSVSKLSDEDVEKVMKRHSVKEKREISQNQRFKILEAFQRNPSPLYLKLSLNAVVGRFKFEYRIEEFIQHTLNDAIEHLFRELEIKYGTEFVGMALGYITAAKCGLTECELEDLLSCDNYVIDHVYRNWKCSVRRFPVLMIARLRSDLGQYLGKYIDDGKEILFWTHKKFENVAKVRYVDKKSKKKTIHNGLAEFFSGKWSGDNGKPYFSKNGKTEAVRHAVTQPITFGNRINERKLKCLPFHQTSAGLLQELKNECLLNINFMFYKLKCTSVHDLLDDFTFAIQTYPKEKCFQVLRDALFNSSRALQRDPRQLPGQLLDRLDDDQLFPELGDQCKYFAFPYIISKPFMLKKERDARITFDGHCEGFENIRLSHYPRNYFVTCIALMKVPGAPFMAVTASDGDQSIRITDLESGRLLMVKSLKSYGNLRPMLRVTNSGFVVHCSTNVLICEETEHVIPVTDDAHVETCGKENNTVVIFDKEKVTLLDSKSGVVKKQIPNSCPNVSRDSYYGASLSYGSENFIAVTSFDRTTFGYFSVAKQQFSEFIKPPVTGQDLRHIAISTDESQIMLFMEGKDLAIYDIESLVLTKTLTVFAHPNCPKHFQLYVIEESIYFATFNGIYVYDFEFGELTGQVPVRDEIKDVKSLDLRTFVTITETGIIQMKNIEAIEQRKFKTYYRSVLPMTNTRYLLLIKGKEDNENNWLLEIYDIKEQEVVRRSKCKIDFAYARLLDDEHLIIATRRRKIKVLHIDTMTVKTVFQGFISPENTMIICHERQEIFTPTRGRHGIKSYDITSGKTKWLLPCSVQRQYLLNDIEASKSGEVICCFTDQNHILICDSVKKEVTQVIKARDFEVQRFEESMLLSPSGKHLVINVTKKKIKHEFQLIWDIQHETSVSCISKREEEEGKHRTNSSGIVIIDDEVLVEGKDYGVIRVWDLKTGEHIRDLLGHDDEDVTLHYEPGGPYIVSETRSRNDVFIMIWDIKTWDCVATFRTDPDVLDGIHLLSDGRSMVGEQNGNIVHLFLFGDGYQDNIDNEPKIFQSPNLTMTTHLSDPTDKNEDPNDPDKEEEDGDYGEENSSVECPFCAEKNVDDEDDDDSDDDDDDDDNDKNEEDEDEYSNNDSGNNEDIDSKGNNDNEDDENIDYTAQKLL